MKCRYDLPSIDEELDAPAVQFLPPPPGVIILKPGKVREQAGSCPEEFREIISENNWRFCVDPQNLEEIPPLMVPPIGEISFEKAQEIHRRHRGELIKLPGVDAVGLGADGIHVYTNDPSLLPKEVEGVPVIPFPARGGGRLLSHTEFGQVFPLHGGIAIRDDLELGGTLTGVVLSQGKPWLVFPAHLVSDCLEIAPCAPGSPETHLNQCPHYNDLFESYPRMIQPLPPGSPRVGVATRWTRLSPFIASPDVAAAFLDNDTIDANGSLFADRKMTIANSDPIPFSGKFVSPVIGSTVKMRTSGVPKPDGSHEFRLRVREVDLELDNITAGCEESVGVSLHSQTDYLMLDPYTIKPGDSGSPVVDGSGNLVGMVNGSATAPFDYIGFGTNAPTIKLFLQFDQWYGTDSVIDQTIGVFRTGSGNWVLDKGDSVETACGPVFHQDLCYSGFGVGSVAITGDWNGDGKLKIGVHNSSNGTWILDYNGDGQFTNCSVDRCVFNFGQGVGQLPVAGNWSGSANGKAKIGFYNSTNGTWILDYNGDLQFTNCTVDRCYFNWGTGLRPVAGDWSGQGTPKKAKIGTFDPATGNWRLDFDGNGQLNCTADRCYNGFGAGTQGIAADWNGTGTTWIAKIAQFTSPAGNWILDMNGNGAFDDCFLDHCIFGRFGKQSGDQPVAWNKSEVKAN